MKSSLTILGAAAIIGVSIIIAISLFPDPGISEQNSGQEYQAKQQKKEMLLQSANLMYQYVKRIQGDLREIGEIIGSSVSSGHKNVSEHAESISELTEKISEELIKFNFRETQLALDKLERIDHMAHELESAADSGDHNAVHHVHENLIHEVEGLKEEVKDIRSRL